MNASEGSYQLELTRPPDRDFKRLSYAEQQMDFSRYYKWLRAAYEFDKDLFDKEMHKYIDSAWGGTSPEEFGGRGDYLGVCEHCGK